MIIDFHTHVFPAKIAGSALDKLSRSSDITPHTDGTVKGLRGVMRGCGVGASVTLPVATNPDSVVSMNNFSILLSSVPGIIPFGAMHHGFSGWKSELRRIRAAGIKGIKLHPDYQDVFIEDPRVVDIIRECGRLGLVVLTHAGLDLAFKDCIHCTPEMIARLLPDIAGTTFIAAHFGGYMLASKVLEHLAGRDIYFDTSFSFPDEPELCAEIVRRHRADRLLFGSDSPWGDPAASVRFIRGLGLGRELEDKIFFENALSCLA